MHVAVYRIQLEVLASGRPSETLGEWSDLHIPAPETLPQGVNEGCEIEVLVVGVGELDIAVVKECLDCVVGADSSGDPVHGQRSGTPGHLGQDDRIHRHHTIERVAGVLFVDLKPHACYLGEVRRVAGLARITQRSDVPVEIAVPVRHRGGGAQLTKRPDRSDRPETQSSLLCLQDPEDTGEAPGPTRFARRLEGKEVPPQTVAPEERRKSIKQCRDLAGRRRRRGNLSSGVFKAVGHRREFGIGSLLEDALCPR